MKKLRVSLGERSYDIVIGTDTLRGIGEKVRDLRPSKTALITNTKVFDLYGASAIESLKNAGLDPHTVIIPDGEEYKNLLWADYIYGELLRARLDRASLIVALGGGVIGDMAGFVASTYMRGIRFIQVPTTLLAQVDSSVGGKTGVNHPLGKNMIGTFYQPALVWIDTKSLATLPKRQFLAGIAEVIKYGVIWDSEFFSYLEKNTERILSKEPEALIHIISRSCEIKAEVVSKDERESGLRAILNYGHTVGHALETVTGYRTYLHGEAIAIGMVAEARLSYLSSAEISRLKGLIDAYGLPTELPPEMQAESLLTAMEVDKKALSGALRFVLPESIGSVVLEQVDREKIASLLKP